MYRLFIDTNVLVDYYLGIEPGCSACKELIALCLETPHALFISPQSFKDAYYVIYASLKRMARTGAETLSPSTIQACNESAWGCARHMLETFLIAETGASTCLQGIALHDLHSDLEDDLVIAAARETGADFLVTSDEKLRKHAPIACLPPREMFTFLNAERAPGNPAHGEATPQP